MWGQSWRQYCDQTTERCQKCKAVVRWREKLHYKSSKTIFETSHQQNNMIRIVCFLQYYITINKLKSQDQTKVPKNSCSNWNTFEELRKQFIFGSLVLVSKVRQHFLVNIFSPFLLYGNKSCWSLHWMENLKTGTVESNQFRYTQA